jgi:ABC-2 type transport system ATP-binding protein
MPEAVIQACRLSKTYRSKQGEREAVRSVDLEVRAGEFFGLLGPNGAGKSTTIGMLTTLVLPSDGSATVAGFDIRRQTLEVKRRISLVTQVNAVDRDLTVRENLEFRSRYWGFNRRAARQRAAELLERFGLGGHGNALFYQLSGGQLRRMLIARALVQRPDILFLDEPTAGIDPLSRINLWEVLRELHQQGQTIVLTTHNLDEAERFCHRAAIIDQGRVLVCDTVEALVAGAGGEVTVTAVFDRPLPDSSAAAALRQRPGVREVRIDGAALRVATKAPDGLLPEITRLTEATGCTLLDLSTARPNLESAFLALTGRDYQA